MKDRQIEHANKVKDAYFEKFGDVPMIPMMQSDGTDGNYIGMLEDALERGSPVTDKDYVKHFPAKPGVKY